MKVIIKQSNKMAAFTIIELLTVMSVIIILFGLLVPAMNIVKRHAKRLSQKAQFHSIGVALNLFGNEWEGYPESDWEDPMSGSSANYCGAMKLCEAMVGQDLLGFHPDSFFNATGTNSSASPLYPNVLNLSNPQDMENLRARRGPYLPLGGANVNTLGDLYGPRPSFGSLGDSDDPNGGVVLCDEYPRMRNRTTGEKIGMPILYYRADTSQMGHAFAADNSVNIYNYDDNMELVALNPPWRPSLAHPMSMSETPGIFYADTLDDKVDSIARPERADSYILLSAGFDGLYGTGDDVFNFGD